MFRASLFILLSGIALAFPVSAPAYMGPTLGLGVIGTVIAVVALLLLSLFAFIFVPIRRMLKKTKQKSVNEDTDS